MIRYSYNRQVAPPAPPAPFIHVTLRCVETGKKIAQLPAQLDTARRSNRASRKLCGGIGASALGRVQLEIHDWPPMMLEVMRMLRNLSCFWDAMY